MKLNRLLLNILSIILASVISANAQQSNEWVVFMGRFHPLVVHFPIAFISLQFLFWFINIITKKPLIDSSSIFLNTITFVSSLLSVILGKFLQSEGGYSDTLLEWHERMGYLLTFFSALILFINIRFAKSSSSKINIVYSIMIVFVTIFMILAGHFGGSLTHGENFLTEHNPFKPKPEIKEIKDINTALLFEDLIQPIFNKKCISCHNASKIKGDLRLDSYEWCLKQGESGKTFVAFKPEESEIMLVVNLNPKDEPERAMPPEGKTPLTDDEKKLIAWWIKTGLAKNKKIAELMPDEEIKSILKKIDPKNQSSTSDTKVLENNIFETIKVKPIISDTIKSFSEKGIFIIPLVKNSNLVAIRFEFPERITNREMALLSAIKDNITELYLNNSSINDSSMNVIKNFKNLSRLHLENTKITSKSITQLSNCTTLQYLNLHNTAVDQSCITTILQIKSLNEICLWKTKIDSTTAAQLKPKIRKVIL